MLAAATLSAQEVRQPADSSPPFVVKFPPGALAPDSHYSVQLHGSFGENGTSGQLDRAFNRIKKTAPDEYAISTVTDEGGRATSLRAMIYSSAYGIALFDVPSLAAHPTRTAAAPARTPLGRMRIAGRVLWPTSVRLPTASRVQVSYLADWACEFFNRSDCLVDSFRVGSAVLDAHSQFSLEVPDFELEPAIRRFASKGKFAFDFADSSFRLEPANGTTWGIPVTRARELIVLTAVKPKRP